MKCGEAIVAALEAHGVEVVFGIPGTHNLPIYEPLATSSIRHVTPRHEQGAGFGADGYARASGKPGVCIVTTGPAVTNIMTAGATAYHDSIPLLIISPGMWTDIQGTDSGYLHEIKNQSLAFDSLVSWSRRAMSTEETVAAIHEAFEHFSLDRPRPIHIEIPIDILADGEWDGDVSIPAPSRSIPAPDPAAITAAAEALRGAENPWLLLGGGSRGAYEQARLVAERVGAIAITSSTAKGVVPESHPLSVGAALRSPKAREELQAADVVLAVGTEFSESDLWTDKGKLDGTVIRVDIDETQLQKNTPAAITVLSDAALTLDALLIELGDETADASGAEQRAAELRTEIMAGFEESKEFAEIHAGLHEALEPDAIVSGDSSQITYYGTIHQLPMEHPRQFLYPVGYAPLGYGIPAAIGAKVAFPDRQVVGICGDGAFMFSAMEIAAAVEMELSMPFIVYNNQGYAEIKDGMLARGAKPLAVDLTTPDFSAFGEGIGAHGVRATAETVGKEVSDAFGRKGPTVIEVIGPPA